MKAELEQSAIADEAAEKDHSIADEAAARGVRNAIRKVRWYKEFTEKFLAQIQQGVSINEILHIIASDNTVYTMGELLKPIDPTTLAADDMCAICQELFTASTDPVVQLPCPLHYWHPQCISKALSSDALKRCPMCEESYNFTLEPDFSDAKYARYDAASTEELEDGYGGNSNESNKRKRLTEADVDIVRTMAADVNSDDESESETMDIDADGADSDMIDSDGGASEAGPFVDNFTGGEI